MAERTKEVGIRLSVKDAAAVRATLLGVGSDGEKALKLIDNAARKANPSLLTLSNGIQRSKEYARDFAVEGARSFLGPVLAITTAAGAVELVRQGLEKVQQLAEKADLAERIGIDLPKLQGLQATFKESGNDVGELNGALSTFTSNLQKAASQGGPLKDIFDINKVKITGDTLTDLKTYADLVKNAGNQQQRLYLVTQAFGRGSKELNDLLVQGSEGIGRAADEAERLGAANNAIDAQKARDLVKELAQVEIKANAAGTALGLLISPAEIGLLDTFTLSVKDLTYFLDQLSKGNYGEALKTVVGEGFDAGARLRVVERQLKMGTATPGLTPDQAKDFYSSFDLIKKPLEVTVNGGTTKTPTAPDPAKKRVDDLIASLRQQLSVLGMTDREQEISNNLSKAHVTAASDQGKEIRKLTGDLYDEKRQLDATNSATAFLAQTGESVFEGLIDGTKSWQDVLGDTVKTLEKAVLQAALLGDGPLSGILGTQSDTKGQTGGILGSLLSGLVGAFTKKSAEGNVFMGSRDLHSYANSVVHQPTPFRFATGMGIMGEQPGSPGEAILPLLRDGKGRLGVSGAGAAAPQVAVSVQIVRMPGSGQDSVTTSQQGNVKQIKALIYDTVAEGGSKPGNPVNKMLRTNFGTRQQLTRRGS